MPPSLGQLQSLRSLDIEGFGQLDSIGMEFYKNRDNDSLCIAPFPSLEFLKFCNMPCLEVWHSFDSYAFPQLKKLQLQNCPLLKGDLPNHLPALERLDITEGSQELLFDMKNLLIRGCHPEVESMSKAMSINHLAFLKVMHIFNYSSAVAIPSNHLPKSLARLRIDNCSKVEFPKQQQHQYDLVELVIENSCDSLTSFSLELFPKLELLQIRKCASMESLSMSLSQHTALHRLVISKCPNFVSFPGEGLAMPNLAYFVVMKCYKLKSLPCHMNVLLPSLEFLNIYGCPGIQAFPEGGLPPNLKKLYVGGCDMQLSSLSCHRWETLRPSLS
ncbi:Putative disease resistance protein [Arachis hypogaea]|nr:Putative disease resistance protein [Arachis hypogaea]